MAGKTLTEENIFERWGISRLALEKLIARKLLSVNEVDGELQFSEDEVVALEQSQGGDDFVGRDEAILELHIGAEELNALVASGKLPQYNFGGEPRFHMADLRAVASMAEVGGDETADITSADTIPAVSAEEAKLDLGMAAAGKGDEADLFDFSEAIGDEGAKKADKKKAPAKKEEFPETDMITEIVDVSGAETGEEDILGDIIEDVGAEADLTDELTAAPGGDDTVDSETSQEPTAEITELEEETLGGLEPSEEVTAEITQLEEETFEGEELENILAGEEESAAAAAGAEAQAEDFEMAYAAPVAAAPETPVPVWMVVLLFVILAVQVVGGLFVVETAISPEHTTGITRSLNLFGEE
jgi:hypothetical protein